ncbi:MAG: hypothetical protein HRU19_08785 [Pseudobacteriovorax sp.]|nr:hypothetical protein [Pseudobacteriovorax sp.]
MIGSSKFKDESGAIATEFVVVLPIIAILWILVIEMHSIIDQKILTEVGVRNFSQAYLTTNTEEILSTSRESSPEIRDNLVNTIAGIDYATNSVKHETPATGNPYLENKDGFSASFRQRFRERRQSDNDWLKDREAAYLALEGFQDSTYHAASKILEFTMEATEVLDQIKSPGGKNNLLIDDANATLESQIDINIPPDQGLFPRALSYLSLMSMPQKSNEAVAEGGSEFLAEDFFERPIRFRHIIYRETETGFRPHLYDKAGLFAWTFGRSSRWATGRRVQRKLVDGVVNTFTGWFEVSVSPAPKRNYGHNCPFSLHAGDKCETKISLMVAILTQVGTIIAALDALSLGIAKGAKIAAEKAIFDVGLDILTDSLAAEIEKKADEEIEGIIASFKDNLEKKSISKS